MAKAKDPKPPRPKRDGPAAKTNPTTGTFYVLRTGCQWKALDAMGIRPGSTEHLRFQEWVGRWGVSGTVAGGAGTL